MKFFYTILILTIFAGINNTNAQTINFNGPEGSGEFGKNVIVLTNGNYVVHDPAYNEGTIRNVGAVYLYNGTSHELISTLKGSSLFDEIGSLGIFALNNGNFIINSPRWDNGTVQNVGAVTLVNGVTGLSGVVSSSNSLVGSTEYDEVGMSIGLRNGIFLLNNGNFVVSTANWDDGTKQNVGAITWVNGNTGITGPVSSSNSLIGSTTNDQIGQRGVEILSNGNYVVRSSNWRNSANISVGAVTFGNGNTGITGEINSANSLVGSSPSDNIGRWFTELNNGNYVVYSHLWNNGSLLDAGAITWCNGSTGTTGEVSIANSIVGEKANDQIGSESSVVALSNGHFVVVAPYWDNGTVTNVGAVTWCNGNLPLSGHITEAFSLIGSNYNDNVGFGGITALANGNYVVTSINWKNSDLKSVGAVTLVDGTGPVSLVVGSLNSLIGSKEGDRIGSQGIKALANGNYVVCSPYWSNGIIKNAGAVTWGNGITGVTGNVGSLNSLIGTTTDDYIGAFEITELANGNYVIGSHVWDNGTIENAGAVTWADGNTGVSGIISSGNSLLGSTAQDGVGEQRKIISLANGNFVINSPLWDNGAIADAGAVTWANGNTGITGEINNSNSLVGVLALEKVGSEGLVALTNGNYVVRTRAWINDESIGAGAVTWANGNTGITGEINVNNSLIGRIFRDYVGSGGVTALANGNYTVLSPLWNNGSILDAGAVTLGNGSTGTTGLITNCNSVLGLLANNGQYMSSTYNYVNDYLIVQRPKENTISIFNPTAISLANSMDAVSVNIAGNNTVPFITSDCRIIAALTPGGINAVRDGVSAKAWIETSVLSYLGEPFVSRHYQITPASNASTATAKITLYFTQQEFDDFNAHPGSNLNLPANATDAAGVENLRIKKFAGTSIDGTGLPGSYTGNIDVINPADNDIVWNAMQSRWEVSFYVEGFSGFIVETSSVVLPLTLLEFNGILQNDNALLNWKTDNEQNTRSFIIERSIDGQNYLSIGNVNAANTNGIQNYSFTDNDIKNLGAAIVYYRLKQIDIDGSFVYSQIVALSVGNKSMVLLYPNPGVNEINILVSSNKKSQAQLKILDNLGRVVRQQEVNLSVGNNSISIDIKNLSKGIYNLVIKGEGINKRKRFIKQ